MSDPIVSYYQKQMQSMTRHQVDSMFQSLVVAVEPAPLSEEAFVYHFLPYFSGQKPFPENEDIFAVWYAIAGTPGSRVRVIDGNGKTLYVVPPLINTAVIQSVQGDAKRSLQQMYDTYDLVAGQGIPAQTQKFLIEATTAKLDDIVPKVEVNQTDTEIWHTIFKRYGIKVESNEPLKAEEPTDYGFIYD